MKFRLLNKLTEYLLRRWCKSKIINQDYDGVGEVLPNHPCIHRFMYRTRLGNWLQYRDEVEFCLRHNIPRPPKTKDVERYYYNLALMEVIKKISSL